MNNNDTSPVTQRCLRYVQMDRSFRTVVGRALESGSITMMQWLLLSIVYDGPPAGITMSTAARTLDVTLPQVTALTNELLKNKLIKQKTQSYDRRTRLISATAKGSKVLEESLEAINAAVGEWFSGVPEDQVRAYWDVVERLNTKNQE